MPKRGCRYLQPAWGPYKWLFNLVDKRGLNWILEIWMKFEFGEGKFRSWFKIESSASMDYSVSRLDFIDF
jgi:hypothetical protein